MFDNGCLLTEIVEFLFFSLLPLQVVKKKTHNKTGEHVRTELVI